MNPAPRVWTRNPEGGDHLPEGRRATTTPEPPAPEMWRPVRKVVKIARPWADCITDWGILTRTVGLVLGPGEREGEGRGDVDERLLLLLGSGL